MSQLIIILGIPIINTIKSGSIPNGWKPEESSGVHIGVHQPLYSGSSGCKRIQNPLKSNIDSEGEI